MQDTDKKLVGTYMFYLQGKCSKVRWYKIVIEQVQTTQMYIELDQFCYKHERKNQLFTYGFKPNIYFLSFKYLQTVLYMQFVHLFLARTVVLYQRSSYVTCTKSRSNLSKHLYPLITFDMGRAYLQVPPFLHMFEVLGHKGPTPQSAPE